MTGPELAGEFVRALLGLAVTLAACGAVGWIAHRTRRKLDAGRELRRRRGGT